MEVSTVTRSVLRMCYFTIILSLVIGCHPVDQEGHDSATVESEQFRFLTPIDLKREFSQGHVARLHEVLTSSILPGLSGRDREEVLGIIDYLEKIQKEMPTYFEVQENRIKFLTILMQLHVMAARHNPDNFELNLNVATSYMQNAFLIEDLAQSEDERHLIERYKASGIEASKHLVNNFPDHAMSYAQLAHSLFITGGDKQRVTGLLNHCLKIDQGSDYCREFLETLESE